jgi:hypothetical protein
MPEGSLKSKTLKAETEDQLQELLRNQRRTDGLPVILPTQERVESMLEVAAFAGFERDIVIGQVGPNMGFATIEKIAINAVMAGCQPEQMPVVIAAISAICDPRLDMTEVQATTHLLTPLLIINGPAVQDCGIASGSGALGYGHTANLCIGRAVRLCLINLGGTWPGISDMSLLGQPGMISYCLGEAEESSPFEPLHVSLGYPAESSVVTVTCVGAPHSIMAVMDADDPNSANRLLELLAITIASEGNNSAVVGTGTIVVCLTPDHAKVLSEAGYNRRRIQEELTRRAHHPARYVHELRYGPNHAVVKALKDPDDPHYAIGSPASVLVFVAGGLGLYSYVMLPWCRGTHENPYVSKEIVFSDMCDFGGPIEVVVAPA